MERPVIARPRRGTPVLICKKCLKRSPCGSKIRKEIKRELKHRRDDAPKAAKLVATGCFGICPKKSVVMANGSSLQKGEYVLVSRPVQAGDALTLLRSTK